MARGRRAPRPPARPLHQRLRHRRPRRAAAACPRAGQLGGRPRVRAVGDLRRMAGGGARSQLAGGSAAARRRDDRGRSGRPGSDRQRDRAAALRGWVRGPVRGPRGPSPRASADGLGGGVPGRSTPRVAARAARLRAEVRAGARDDGGRRPQRTRAACCRSGAGLSGAEADRHLGPRARGAGADGRARRDRGDPARAGEPARDRAEPVPPPRRVRPHPGGPEGDDFARAGSRRRVR